LKGLKGRTRTHRGRVAGCLAALPPYQGSKRKLLGHVSRLLPPPAEAPVLLDAFCGGCAVSLFAKRRGYSVRANDLAERAVIVARALLPNNRVLIEREDLLRLFPSDEGAPPGFVERMYAGSALPARQCRFLDRALPAARSLHEPKRSLLLLLLMRFIIDQRPMGNWGARRIIEQLDGGDYDAINASFLRDRTIRAAESHPLLLLEQLRKTMNAGVFAGAPCEVSQEDVFAFLGKQEAPAAFLDPPYPQTSSYEASLKPLDTILAGCVVEAEPSVFSGRDGVEALDRLLEACRHVPVIVLSYGNAAITPEDLQALVAKHRSRVHMETIAYKHLPSLASEESKARNLEVLLRAERAR
jgi:adenine-specific DNA methylase